MKGQLPLKIPRRSLTTCLLMLLVMLPACGGPSAEDAWLAVREIPPCQAQAEPEPVSRGIVRYCGPISAASVHAVKEMLAQQDASLLVLSSLGGEILPAIDLAEFLKARQIRLQVSGVCLSACAQFILFGAPELFVTDRTVVGMHHNQNVLNRLRGEVAIPDWLAEIADAELRFYEAHSVPDDIIFGPFHRLDATCIENLLNNGVSVRMGYNYYMPDEGTFQRLYSGKLASPWPTEAEVSRNIERVIRSGGTVGYLQRLVYGPLLEDALTPVEALPLCEQ